MRWPWTSVARLDDLRADRDHWRQLAERSTDALIRLERRAVGLPETMPQKRERVVIPPEVQAMCDAWGSPSSRAAAEAKAVKLYQQHKDWTAVGLAMGAEFLPVGEP